MKKEHDILVRRIEDLNAQLNDAKANIQRLTGELAAATDRGNTLDVKLNSTLEENRKLGALVTDLTRDLTNKR